MIYFIPCWFLSLVSLSTTVLNSTLTSWSKAVIISPLTIAAMLVVWLWIVEL